MATIILRSAGVQLKNNIIDSNFINLNTDKLDKVDATAQTVVSAVTFNDLLTADKGVVFPATQVPSANVNTLDDYEEGTFTPSVWDALSGGNEADGYTTQEGVYTKIGNVVYISLTIRMTGISAMTAGNDIYIRGLPFTQRTTVNGDDTIIVMRENGINGNTPTGAILSNSTTMKVFNTSSTATEVYILISSITTATGMWNFQGHYFV